jgi:hypothetical protein
MPSSTNLAFNNNADFDNNAPMAFRRERFWFISFVMTPFRDIDQRAVVQPLPNQSNNRRG